jgi:hypothetical protein
MPLESWWKSTPVARRGSKKRTIGARCMEAGKSVWKHARAAELTAFHAVDRRMGAAAQPTSGERLR